MAEPCSEKKLRPEEKCVPGQRDEDESFSYVRSATMYGNLEVVRDWLEHHGKSRPDLVTDLVLSTAAMYGQLEVLQHTISFGDIHRKSTLAIYPGWTLMHFAVHGVQMVFPENGMTDGHANAVNIRLPQLSVAYLPGNQPQTMQEVHWRQMDVILWLANSGAPLTELDQKNHSPSFNAVSAWDPEERFIKERFTDGAILIDILASLKLKAEGSKAQITTPGLAVRHIPNNPEWKTAIQQLVEWAYRSIHNEVQQNFSAIDILIFCHKHHLIDLTSPEMVLSHTHRPLIMDAVRREDYRLLRCLIEASKEGRKEDVLTRVYEYDLGTVGKCRESPVSYACRMFTEGNLGILHSFLSPRIIGTHLSVLILNEVGLRHLPAELFHENLKAINVQSNNLTELPSANPAYESLNWNCPLLKMINISHNMFTEIPPDLFRLPKLEKIFASNNQIRRVPIEMWTAPILQQLDLSQNQIASLPCPESVRRPTMSGNIPISPVASYTITGRHRPGLLPSVRQTHINFDAYSSEEIHKAQSGFCLATLDLTGNQLTQIPRGLACLAPLLNALKLAKNRITNLGSTEDYPSFLHTLEVSRNAVTKGVTSSLNRNLNSCLQSQLATASQFCTHCNHQRLNQLKFLYLSDNKLEELEIEYEPSEEFEHTVKPGTKIVPSSPPLLYPRLQGLKLSNNRLTSLPDSTHRLGRLCELAIDGNPSITQLPLNLHRLTNLFTFKYEGIGDPIQVELAKLKSTCDILYYLRARETSAVQNTSLRLFIIGHYHKGKTTLLSRLRGRPPDTAFDQTYRARRIHNEEFDGPSSPLNEKEKASTVGIDCGKWECRRRSSRKSPKITFYTWDFAGQEEYYLTHQCFLTNRALYVLVWNVLDGDEGIDSLSIWLQNLQAKAPGATVVIVGTHLDLVLKDRDQKCRRWADKLEKYKFGRKGCKTYPQLKAIHFVGCPEKKRIEVDKLNDILYDIALDMDAPRDLSGRVPMSLRIKILQEMIPKSYDDLRKRIEEMVVESRQKKDQPILHKDVFYEKVRHIVPDPEEVETAVDYLQTTTGIILHFRMPMLINYYVIDPQHWFDLCALVISPDNVSRLVRNTSRDQGCGLLNCQRMDKEFKDQGYPADTSKLLRIFLQEYHVIHQINRELCLVPSAIDPDPGLCLSAETGSFPWFRQEVSVANTPDEQGLVSLSSYGPASARRPVMRNMQVKKTGLVYRRMLHLPPIASGFWSKLISLFIQKEDFQQIIHNSAPGKFELQAATHCLLCMIGNLSLQWQYWKTGIMLKLEDQLLLRVNSLHSDAFRDPHLREALSHSEEKVKYFFYKTDKGNLNISSLYTETIEVIVPEVYLVRDQSEVVTPQEHHPMSTKILAKALEIVDEVLKNHCEHLATTGIYTVSDMLHVIPCPLCFGDEDNRPVTQEEDAWKIPQDQEDAIGRTPSPPLLPPMGVTNLAPAPKKEPIFVVTVDQCIKQTFVADYIECPVHEKLEFQYLAPDLVFSDLADAKLDKTQLNAPIDTHEQPAGRGSFGMVIKRILKLNDDEKEIEVAVKIFEQYDALLPDSPSELAKNYSDMRYELNKLSSLHHPYIVKFIGVFTNPHCFVLEWAPKKGLENIRQAYEDAKVNFCPTSIFLTLLQVTEALTYIHDKIRIVHNDLKCGNILAFRFPEPGHCCFAGGESFACAVCMADLSSCDVDPSNYGVLVKLADMGICANPAARRTKNFAGIRQLVPECLTFDANITEKVDIFTLGSCLYELMSLRGLPPIDVSEAEYRAMLQTGNRAQFYTKDAAYPLLLFQLLEECWQQEHFKRPSAAKLKETLEILTGLSTADGKVGGSFRKMLMDSFIVHQSHRVSSSHAVTQADSFSVCAALLSPDESKTDIVVITHYLVDPEESRTEIDMQTIGEVRNTARDPRENPGWVSTIHMTSEGNVLVGCGDGKLMVFKTINKSKFVPSEMCSRDEEHGEIVGIYYHTPSNMLVIGFAGGSCGRVHIHKCTQGIRNGLTTQWRRYCCPLNNDLPLHVLECVSLSPSTLDVWCGSKNSTLEVWSFPVSSDIVWTTESMEKESTTIEIAQLTGRGDMTVKQMKLSCDSTMMIVLLYQPSSQDHVIIFVDIKTKKSLKSFPCTFPVASLTTSLSKLFLGTYEGAIYCIDINALLQDNGDHHSLSVPQNRSQVLQGHYRSVYSMFCLEGYIDISGTTSFFPTFVGQAMKSTSQEFLVSIGYGRGFPEVKGIFKTSSQRHGTYLNTWIV